MEQTIKKNINLLISIFLLISPFIDVLTGICLHYFKINITIGIFVKMFFLLFIVLTVLFIYKKKKLLIPYFIIFLYCLLFLLGQDNIHLFNNIQNVIKVFYFPILLISLFSIKEEIRISKLTLFTTLFFYLILIFVPLLLGIGYQTYEITKLGTLGFYNSANEVSGIISILTPILWIIIIESKNIIPKILLFIMYLTVILMIGTKTPLLSLIITIMISILYLWRIYIKEKKYKNICLQLLIIIIGIISFSLIIPKTNFYKNIRTHLDYLELDHITEVFHKKGLIDHFIFSERLSFLDKKAKIYDEASLYQKLFGIGYYKNNKATKVIEMDYFDIYYSHGIIGFIVFFIPTVYITYCLLKENKKKSYETTMLKTSFLLIVLLSFFTGHILIAPSVSIIVCILLLQFTKYKKKDLLFASYSMDLGGIEKALLTLVNRIDYNKYNVTVILEKKEGLFLDKINKEVNVKELKVSNNKNIIIRKIMNSIRKLCFKIINYHNYDFSCCYATYSYSSSKIALMSSNNTAIFVHADYTVIYNENEFYHFFNSRNIENYKNIIFVSNENREKFIKKYKSLTNKCKVFNNFVDIEEIKEMSKKKISEEHPKNKQLLVYIGRLDEHQKRLTRQIELVRKIKEIELWLIGDGPDKEMYQKEIKKYNLENQIKFLGRKNNPYPYMNKADYIILTSEYEGFPVTYLEAITLGKRIITTFPTSDELVDISKYGYVISKDIDEMVNEVKTILKQKDKKEIIDLNKVQNNRMKQLELMFNGEENE